MKSFDIIIVTGELFFDHPLSGPALIKRILEKHGYSVGLIEMPKNADDIAKLGAPKLYFGVTSGSIDSMLRNYTPLKKDRHCDPNFQAKDEIVPNRALIVYSNWIKSKFKGIPIVLGGVEATMRRFVHYDYWDNKLRRPVLLDAKADILVFGNGEKQVVEIAQRISGKKSLQNIAGTCIASKDIEQGTEILPSFEEVTSSKERFVDFQLAFCPNRKIAQQIDNRYIVQAAAPVYTAKDLDEYYELPFTRQTKDKSLQGFVFSIVTHRGCVGECSFCSLSHTQGNRIVSRSEESILREVRKIVSMPHFTGNIDDFGGASANMYGMDCNKCFSGSCIDCGSKKNGNSRLITLLRKARAIPGVKKINIRSGVRFDLADEQYIKEICTHHLFDTLRIAPEHVNKNVLKLMNKEKGNLDGFIRMFKRVGAGRKLSFYYMTAHPGSSMKEAKELADFMGGMKNTESFQVFTPTPGTLSTCMYYTELNPWTREPIHVPKSYIEKKEQKRLILKYLRNP